MRTTLVIDDDVLAAARRLAARERTSVGAALSSLARQSLARETGSTRSIRTGVLLVPKRKDGEPVTLELVNQLRDEPPQ